MKKITQNLRWLVTLLAMIVCTGAWAQEVTYDFTGSDWSVSNGVLTNGTVSFTGEGKGSKANFKMNNGYFMLGQNGAYINFPTYDFAVERIEVVGRDGASASVKQNIYVGDDAVSTETSGATGTNTYEIASAYQATGTQYTLKVTSAHNTQITAIKIYKKVNSNAELVSIAVSDYPANFYVGDIFSHEGAKVTATFSDNSTQEVTSQAEFTTPDMTSAGTKAVTVSYTRGDVTKTTSYDIVVSAVALESIAISGNYPKTFEQGNAFSHEGAIVTATYNNGSTQNVTADATFTTPDMSTLGTKTVSVSYTENNVTKETSYDITIEEPYTPEDGVFDFSGTYAYGSGVSTTSDGQYYEEDAHTWTAGNVTLVTEGKYRWWYNANGNSLRLYDPSTLSLSVPEGNVITKVEIVGDNTNCLSTENGTYSNGVWTGASRTVVLSKSGDKKPYISSITVTYSNSGETPTPTPSITVDPATVNAPAEETESTLDISYENLDITDMTDFGIQFYDANNQEIEEPAWVEVLVAEAEGGTNYVVSYYMIDNEGDARTAYCKVFATGNDEFVYSNLITINQAAYVAPSDVVYKKVTKTTDITDGQYLIVYEDLNVAFDGSLTTLDAAGNTIDVEINDDNTISGTSETEAAEFTINVTEGSLMSASGKYIGVSSWGNGIKPSDTSDYKNSFAIEEGNAIISIEFSSGNMILNYNSDSNQKRFRYYKNGSQQPIQLYKKVVEEETSPTVTIGASKWATYVAEDNVTFPSEVSAYTVETIDSENSKVALGEVIAVKKGTPILVYSETPGTYTLEVVAEEGCDETYNNKLKVSDGTMTGGSTIYVLAQPQNSEIGFYPLASNVTIPAGKAYLEIIESKAPVKGFFALGELADAINNIAVENANGTIFNIAGQKVQNITKGGLYIVNGKKVFVK